MRITGIFAPLVLATAALAVAGTATAQTHVLKLSSFSAPTSQTGLLVQQYAKEIKEKSGGKLELEVHLASSMGGPRQQYELVRKGVADLSVFMHGFHPGRFPLTELIHTPYAVPDAYTGTRVLMDLVPEYLAKEHEGVKIIWLLTTLPSQIYHASKPLKSLEDLEGQRLRSSTAAVVEVLRELGAAPVGLPITEVAEALQRGRLDGVVTDVGGVYGFRLGGLVKYRIPALDSVQTIGFIMNPDSYARLPDDLKKLIDDLGGQEGAKRATSFWYKQEEKAQAYFAETGVELVKASPELDKAARSAAAKVLDRQVEKLEAKGLPAKAVVERMKAASGGPGAN